MLVRSSRATTALAVAAAVTLAAGCGRGEQDALSTTTTPAETTLPSTTTVVDDDLRELLLVAADVPEFKEKPASNEPETDDDPLARCENQLPAARAIEEPEVEGATFVRGAEDAVKVSSSATGTTPGKAEAALNELADPKTTACFQQEFSEFFKDAVPAGAEVAAKITATKSTVAGADQAVLVGTTITARGPAGTVAYRADFVFLRRAGDIVTIFYVGPSNLTTVAERQRIVAAVSKKLGGGTTATTSSSGSTTSVAGTGSSTTRRSTTTTRRSTTSSSRTSTTTTM